MICDLCGSEYERKAKSEYDVPDWIGTQHEDLHVCEGCFMSFEYWKDARKQRKEIKHDCGIDHD